MKIAQVSVDQFCGEADGVRSDCLEAVFINCARAEMGKFNGETKCLKKRFPEGHSVPIKQHTRKSDGDVLVGYDLAKWPIFKK